VTVPKIGELDQGRAALARLLEASDVLAHYDDWEAIDARVLHCASSLRSASPTERSRGWAASLSVRSGRSRAALARWASARASA
jgi:hypothetical protein